jgi:hypothetical protein
MPVRETSSKAKPFLIVYQSRVKATRSIIFSLLLLLASVSLLLMPVNGDGLLGHTAYVLGAYGGPPVFSLTLIWSVRYLFAKKPLLIFDERGITTLGFGLIPWSEIAEVKLHRTMRRRFFAIVARDSESLASRFPEAKANNLRFNHEYMGMATGIGEAMLPMKIERLLTDVGDYCEKNIRIYRTLSPHLRAVVERALNTPPPTERAPVRSDPNDAIHAGNRSISGPALEGKRIAIEKYVESSKNLQDCFDLEDGTGYEGYILEVGEEAILFEWAYSPFTDGREEPPFAIPIAEIDIASLLLKRT